MIWKPHVTVSAIVSVNDKFLLIREISDGQSVINQPSGHLEENETLVDAIIRETLEESAWHFNPSHLIGIYRWKSLHNNQTYIRFAFTGEVSDFEKTRTLDEGIIETLWLNHEELLENRDRLRSPMVLQCINDYLQGKRFPLELIEET